MKNFLGFANQSETGHDDIPNSNKRPFSVQQPDSPPPNSNSISSISVHEKNYPLTSSDSSTEITLSHRNLNEDTLPSPKNMLLKSKIQDDYYGQKSKNSNKKNENIFCYSSRFILR